MILVTGATGLVGSHLLKKLIQEGHAVKALYRNSPPEISGTEGVEWIKGDILDVVALEESMDQVDQVYHCAAVVSFNPAKKAAMQHTNIEGTANVVNACINKGVKRLLFVSSVAALGRIREDKPIDETMNWTPETSNSEYGKTKYLSEMEVWRGMSEGLSVVVVNPVIILGNGDWEGGSSGIFKSAYNEFPWYTEGMSGFVDVKDVVKAMVLLMDSSINGERFILSGHNAYYKDIFGLIATTFHKKPPHKKVTPLLAAIVWRLEAIKAFFQWERPFINKGNSQNSKG